MVLIAVWLFGYPEGFRQSRKDHILIHDPNDKNWKRFFVMQPDWLQRRLQAIANTSADTADEPVTEAGVRPKMCALALVEPGAVFDSCLTEMTDEEQLGFEYFQCPTDFLSFSIKG